MQRKLYLGAIAVLLSACGGSSQDHASTSASVRMGGISQAAAAVDYTSLVQSLYLSFYGRVAEPAGVSYWSGILAAYNLPATASELLRAYNTDPNARMVLDAFGNSQEAQDLYGGTNAEFVNNVYMNLFGRYAEAAGKAYWTALLDRAVITRSFAALTIFVSANGDDQLVEAKRVDAAGRYVASLAQAGVPDTVFVRTVGQDLLALVTRDTDLAVFQARIDAGVLSLSSPGDLPTVTRYTGFNDAYAGGGSPYPVQYRISYGSGIVPVANGKLLFGLGERQIGFHGQPGASTAFTYDAPVTATASIGAPTVPPTALMLCQATTGSGALGKSTDLLIQATARMVVSAKELAGRTLAVYREDCGTVPAAAITFDLAGNATVNNKDGSRVYQAEAVNAALNGMLIDPAYATIISWRAYRYTAADGAVKYVIASRVDPNLAVIQTVPGVVIPNILALWAQE